MNHSLDNYIDTFLSETNPTLQRITEEYKHRVDIAPHIEIQAARVIQWLIISSKAKNIIEFGTCIGYSTIVLAEAAKQVEGKITAIERAKNHYKETINNVREAGLSEYVTVINGDAKTEFSKLDGLFDFILQDSQKALYPEMIDSCIQKLNSGGIIVADDTLFKALGKKEKFANFMHKYNEMVFNDNRIFSTILPIGDGLTISYKK